MFVNLVHVSDYWC